MSVITERSEKGSAVFSRDRRHRYLLTRTFSGGEGVCCFILLNPSRADASTNDPTVARCSGFAQRWGFAELRVVNLFSFMTSRPRDLVMCDQPSNETNDRYALEVAGDADMVVAGWGVHGSIFGRSSQVMANLREACIRVSVFGITKRGEPRHPLYLPYSSTLSQFAEQARG